MRDPAGYYKKRCICRGRSSLLTSAQQPKGRKEPRMKPAVPTGRSCAAGPISPVYRLTGSGARGQLSRAPPPEQLWEAARRCGPQDPARTGGSAKTGSPPPGSAASVSAEAADAGSHRYSHRPHSGPGPRGSVFRISDRSAPRSPRPDPADGRPFARSG